MLERIISLPSSRQKNPPQGEAVPWQTQRNTSRLHSHNCSGLWGWKGATGGRLNTDSMHPTCLVTESGLRVEMWSMHALQSKEGIAHDPDRQSAMGHWSKDRGFPFWVCAPPLGLPIYADELAAIPSLVSPTSSFPALASVWGFRPGANHLLKNPTWKPNTHLKLTGSPRPRPALSTSSLSSPGPRPYAHLLSLSDLVSDTSVYPTTQARNWQSFLTPPSLHFHI